MANNELRGHNDGAKDDVFGELYRVRGVEAAFMLSPFSARVATPSSQKPIHRNNTGVIRMSVLFALRVSSCYSSIFFFVNAFASEKQQGNRRIFYLTIV